MAVHVISKLNHAFPSLICDNFVSATVSENTWWVWCFDDADTDVMSEHDHDAHVLPTYACVCKVQFVDGKCFTCSCGHPHRVGLPCRHVMQLINKLLPIMCHVKFWKVYETRYGTDEGDILMKVQKEQSKVPGIAVTSDCVAELQCHAEHYPLLLHGATTETFHVAKRVMDRSVSSRPVTRGQDLKSLFDAGCGDVTDTDEFNSIDCGLESEIALSDNVARLQVTQAKCWKESPEHKVDTGSRYGACCKLVGQALQFAGDNVDDQEFIHAELNKVVSHLRKKRKCEGKDSTSSMHGMVSSSMALETKRNVTRLKGVCDY